MTFPFVPTALAAGAALAALTAATRVRAVQTLDDAVERWMGPHRARWHSLAGAATLTGEKFVHPLIGAATALAVYLARRPGDPWRAVLPLAAASLGGITVHHVVKFLYHRPRPEVALQRLKTEAAFPSGHTTNATAVVVTSAWILAHEGLLPPAVALGIAGALCLATGASRVALGWHWATDVLGGWLAGAGIAALCCLLYEVLARQ
ncbi:MAG: phosphatase PAP2 family protein [bacterium]